MSSTVFVINLLHMPYYQLSIIVWLTFKNKEQRFKKNQHQNRRQLLYRTCLKESIYQEVMGLNYDTNVKKGQPAIYYLNYSFATNTKFI